MNKNSLILLVTTFALVPASLACGSTRRTTTTTYQSSPTDTTSNIVPPEASKPSEPQPTATLESQINLEIRNYTSFVDWIGSRRFVGEIVNTGNAPAKSVDVALSLLDNNGNVAAVGQTYLSFVPANGKFPFSLVVENAPPEWKDVKIQIQGSPSDSSSFMSLYTDFKTSNVNAQPADVSLPQTNRNQPAPGTGASSRCRLLGVKSPVMHTGGCRKMEFIYGSTDQRSLQRYHPAGSHAALWHCQRGNTHPRLI